MELTASLVVLASRVLQTTIVHSANFVSLYNMKWVLIRHLSSYVSRLWMKAHAYKNSSKKGLKWMDMILSNRFNSSSTRPSAPETILLSDKEIVLSILWIRFCYLSQTLVENTFCFSLQSNSIWSLLENIWKIYLCQVYCAENVGKTVVQHWYKFIPTHAKSLSGE